MEYQITPSRKVMLNFFWKFIIIYGISEIRNSSKEIAEIPKNILFNNFEEYLFDFNISAIFVIQLVLFVIP